MKTQRQRKIPAFRSDREAAHASFPSGRGLHGGLREGRRRMKLFVASALVLIFVITAEAQTSYPPIPPECLWGSAWPGWPREKCNPVGVETNRECPTPLTEAQRFKQRVHELKKVQPVIREVYRDGRWVPACWDDEVTLEGTRETG